MEIDVVGIGHDELDPSEGVAVAGMIPYVEGEGAAGIGILLGINPIMAAAAAMIGNFLSVLAVVTIIVGYPVAYFIAM